MEAYNRFLKYLVMIMLNFIICRSQEFTIRYCENFEPYLSRNSNTTINIPASLTISTEYTTFRLEKQTVNCMNQTKILKLDKRSSSPQLGFTRSGYFRKGYDYYNTDNYCVLKEDKNWITISYCIVDCKKQLCIQKCCPPDEVEDINLKSCSFSGEKRWTPILHHEVTHERLPAAELADINPHYKELKARCFPPEELYPPYVGREDFDSNVFAKKDIKLLKDGSFRFTTNSGKWKTFSGDLYCVDGIQNFGGDKFHSGDEKDFIVLRFAHCDDVLSKDDLQSNTRTFDRVLNNIHAGLMLFSSSFLIITLAVYILLWEKQNIHGWTIMSHVTSLLFMYIFVATYKLSQNSRDALQSDFCVTNAILAHFFFLSTFCWLTVINFDIWWTFRDMKPNPMRSKEVKRYIFYSIFAVGFPIFVIVLGQIIEASGKCPDSDTNCIPSTLISPHYARMVCFLHPDAVGVYLYYLIGALLGINLVFFGSTSFILYRHYQATKRVHDTPGNQSMESIRVFVKLFVVMGITWLFDFLSWCLLNDTLAPYFAVLDFINILQAVAIFFIFVFKRQILTQLWNKYPSLRPFLLPMKKLPCCQRKSFDLERSQRSGTKTLDRNLSRQDSTALSRKDSTTSTSARKNSFEKSFEVVEL